MRRLRRHGLKVGVITRNGREAVDVALARFEHLTAADFDVIVTRDDPVRFKPAPDGLLYAAEHMGVAPGRMLMVGDFVLDLIAGRHAGCVTVYLTNGGAPGSWDSEPACPEDEACDFVIDALDELDGIVRLGLPLAQGKLPAELLAGVPRRPRRRRPGDPRRRRARRGRGRPRHRGRRGPRRARRPDHADDRRPRALRGDGQRQRHRDLRRRAPLAARRPSCCPPVPRRRRRCISSTTSRRRAASRASSRSAATPRSPPPSRSRWCRAPCSASLRRADLRDKRDAREGDRVLLTKALAVEGTAVLAAELGERLLDLGMGEERAGAAAAPSPRA